MAKAAATARPRRSRADVQQDFVKIREEAAASREARNVKAEEAADLKEAEVRQDSGTWPNEEKDEERKNVRCSETSSDPASLRLPSGG